MDNLCNPFPLSTECICHSISSSVISSWSIGLALTAFSYLAQPLFAFNISAEWA